MTEVRPRLKRWLLVLPLMLGSLSTCGEVRKSASTPATTSPVVRRPGECSASALAAPASNPALPEPVASTRSALVNAARTCDFTTLARLASQGNHRFVYRYGTGAGAETFWRNEELTGRRPMAKLVKILSLSSAVETSGDSQRFIWPAAATYDTWVAVPEPERAALRSVYGPQEIAQFRDGHAYRGHRLAIAPDGEWLYFVAGRSPVDADMSA